jgi:hypothetical protein
VARSVTEAYLLTHAVICFQRRRARARQSQRQRGSGSGNRGDGVTVMESSQREGAGHARTPIMTRAFSFLEQKNSVDLLNADTRG